MTVVALVASACSGGGGQTTGGGGASKPCLRAAFVFKAPTQIPGWEGGAAQGVEFLKQQLPCVETRILQNVTEGADAERVFSDLAQQGFNVIFGHSFGYMDTMEKVAARYPKVIFENGSGFKTAANYSNYFGAGYEGSYLAGMAAGSVTKTNKLGWVGPFPVPDILWDINAFFLGAREVNPNVTMQLVWTAKWDNAVLDKQAAESLVSANVDVIGQGTASPSVGEAAQAAGIFWVPVYDKAEESFGPTTALAARHYDWGVAFVQIVKAVMNHTWTNEPYFGDLKDGFIQLAGLNPKVPADIVSRIEQRKQEIIDGTFQIWKGPISDNHGKIVVPDGKTWGAAELYEADAFLVEGIQGSIPQG